MEFTCGQVTLDIFDPSSIGPAVRTEPRRAGAARPRRRRRARRARGQGRRVRRRDDRHRRLPHGVLQGSGRERADAPPPLRTEGRREPRRRARALPVAAAPGHVHGGVALHRPARLRPGLVRPERQPWARPRETCSRSTCPAWLRPGEARSRSTSSRTASSSPRSLKTTSAWARWSAPTTSSRRTTPRRGRAACSSAFPRAWSSTIRSTSASWATTPVRRSGGCSSWPRKAAASR